MYRNIMHSSPNLINSRIMHASIAFELLRDLIGQDEKAETIDSSKMKSVAVYDARARFMCCP